MQASVPMALSAAAPPATAPATRPADSQPASRPTASTRPAGPIQFQPGVHIDWSSRDVLLDGKVVLREGLLELFACSPGTKEHESIVQVQAQPMHVFQALGLIGLEPGHPPHYDSQRKVMLPATGSPVEVLVRWRQDGQEQTVPAWEWMYNQKRDAPAGPIDWVFAGSMRTDDNRLLADYDGTVICVVDFAGAIVSVRQQHSADNADLWLSARTEQIPPVDTPVTLILRGARPPVTIGMDRFGRLALDGRPAAFREVVDAARNTAGAVGILRPDPTLSDVAVEQLRRALLRAGLAAVIIEPSAADETAASRPHAASGQQALAVLAALTEVGQQLSGTIDQAARSIQDQYRTVVERVRAAGHAAEGTVRGLGTMQGAGAAK